MFSIFLTQYNGAILGPIAKVLGWILNVLFDFLSNFGILNAGLCIILFTFIVKTLMIPLTIKQQKFTKLSSKMTPELTKIQEKYKGKKDEVSMRKQQLEMQGVYQKYGANPTSGCLPMLITLPILFALYRVIYNIPAYVDQIYDLYNNIATQIQATSGYADIMTNLSAKMSVKFDASLGINNIIDILSQFKTVEWQNLKDLFPALADTISQNSNQIMHINSFLGVNISNTPITHITAVSILVPILATVTQIVQTKQMTASNPADPSNPGASMMKSMNTVMPVMSGIMCLMLPIGVGIYWIAGGVFQIIQQFFIDRYMDHVNVDELIKKNSEKAKKKKEKLGIDPNMSIEDLAKMQTKSIPGREAGKTKNMSISEKAGYSTKNSGSTKPNVNTDKRESSFNDSTKKYKPGSIAANAHMLSNRYGSDKGDKKK